MALIEASGIGVGLINADTHLERGALSHLPQCLFEQPGADAAVAPFRLHIELLQLSNRPLAVWRGTQGQVREAHCS